MVERVSTYKYSGVTFDNQLCWNKNVSCITKKADTRLYCLMKLRSFGVSTSLLAIFYNAVVCSALTFGVVCWERNISKHEWGRSEKIVKNRAPISEYFKEVPGTLCYNF